VFLRVIFRVSPFLRSSLVLTKDTDSVDSERPIHYSTSDRRLPRAPAFSPLSSLTHSHRCIGPQSKRKKIYSTIVGKNLKIKGVRRERREKYIRGSGREWGADGENGVNQGSGMKMETLITGALGTTNPKDP
jgi:hypothetical protein